jgi:hypothetical protein
MDMEIIINKIPQQLQYEIFGFVKLKPKSKIPFEKDWQNNPYSYNEIQSWIAQGGNYGVQGGYGDLIIIDADTELLRQLVRERLPETFTVKTPRQGYHFYYICKDIRKKIILRKDNVHLGEIISQGAQVVGAGSIHPDTGTEYEVINDAVITEISREQIFTELMEYIRFDFPSKDPEIEINNISILEILNKNNIQTKHIGDQLVCGHPIHGSTNKKNFVVHPGKNVWHCFRCNSGGGILLLIAVLEQIIECHEAHPGVLRGGKYKKALSVARTKYSIEIKSSIVDQNSILLSEDQLLNLEGRIKAISKEVPRTKLPELLNPILKELARTNIAQQDAILKYTIKKHFELNNEDLKSYEKVLKSFRKEPEDRKDNKSPTKKELLEILNDEENSRTIHPAQDFTEGIMTFTVKIKDTPCLIASDKRFFTFQDAEKEGFILRHNTVDTTRFSYKGIKSFIEIARSVNTLSLYNKVYEYIKQFIHFPDESYLNYVTLWVIGTYIFMIFRYYPYVWLNAEKGSGKTLLMEILSAIAFNGELITNPTESVIFRDITNNLNTMFIDEVDQLRKRDKETYGSIIRLLNAGFSKAGVVKRVEQTSKGRFVVKTYIAYSPKMFAGINEIDDVLQDRTVRIPLLRKKDNEIVQRYKETDDILKLQQSIRDDLYIFALNHAREIAEIYHTEGDVIEGMSHLNNREFDIWEPIFLLANMVDTQYGTTKLTDMMEALSKKSAEEKQSDDVSQNETYKLLNLLKAMLDELSPINQDNDIRMYDAEKVFEYFKANDDFDWIQRTNVLTRRLKKVKVVSEQKRIDGVKKRVYILKMAEFQDLCERFKI